MVECLIESTTLEKYYLHIKKYLFDQAKNKRNINFNELKQKFCTQVNSNRKLECVSDIESLVEVLEDRREIQKFKTDLFKEIFDFYNIDKTLIYEHNQFLQSISIDQTIPLQRKINIYALELQRNPPRKLHQAESVLVTTGDIPVAGISLNLTSVRGQQRNHHTTYIGQKTDDVHNGEMSQSEERTCKCNSHCGLNKHEFRIPERVIEIVTSVGRKWTDLARKLLLIEHTINEITDDVSLDLKQKTRKVLAEYEQNCLKDLREEDIIPGLLRALEKIKRNDLRLQVDDFLRRSNHRSSSSFRY